MQQSRRAEMGYADSRVGRNGAADLWSSSRAGGRVRARADDSRAEQDPPAHSHRLRVSISDQPDRTRDAQPRWTPTPAPQPNRPTDQSVEPQIVTLLMCVTPSARPAACPRCKADRALTVRRSNTTQMLAAPSSRKGNADYDEGMRRSTRRLCTLTGLPPGSELAA
jgi:hypothetical protein